MNLDFDMNFDMNFDMPDLGDDFSLGGVPGDGIPFPAGPDSFPERYPNGFDRYNYLPVNDLPDDFSITPKMAEELMHFDELLVEGRINRDEYNETVLRIVEMARKQGKKTKVDWQKNGF